MDPGARAAAFERIVMPHLDAAYNLARWLTKNEADAEDVMQEVMLRAFRFIDGFTGEGARAWVLRIVRNTAFTWLRRNRPKDLIQLEPWQDEGAELVPVWSVEPVPADLVLERQDDLERLNELIEALPAESREVLILRELEGLSYKEISQVADIPIGTVMSRLSRARERLQADWHRTAARSRRRGAR